MYITPRCVCVCVCVCVGLVCVALSLIIRKCTFADFLCVDRNNVFPNLIEMFWDKINRSIFLKSLTLYSAKQLQCHINNMKLIHWPLMGELLHLVQRGGDWAGPQPAQAPPRCTKCNSSPINGQCTNHHVTLLYNGPLLCGFNMPIKGLTRSTLIEHYLKFLYKRCSDTHAIANTDSYYIFQKLSMEHLSRCAQDKKNIDGA